MHSAEAGPVFSAQGRASATVSLGTSWDKKQKQGADIARFL